MNLQKHLLFIGSLLFFVFLFSCNTKDRICQAGDPNIFPLFQYHTNQKIVFKDSLGIDEITVQFPVSYSNSKEYYIKSQSAFSNHIETCERSTELNGTVTASRDSLLLPNQYKFTQNYYLTDDGDNSNSTSDFYIVAFGNVSISGTYLKGNTILLSTNNTKLIEEYHTPYKIYTNVYQCINKSIYRESWPRFVFDSNGKLLSFNLQSDTLKFFYLVE